MTVTTTLLVEEELSVFVVRDDPAVGRVLKSLAKAMHWQVKAYASPQAFLDGCHHVGPGCLLYSVPSGRTNGFAWLGDLPTLGIHLPVIVISACGDVPRVVEAMRAGAHNYLKQPCSESELAEALRDALAWDAENRRRLAQRVRLQRRLDRLTPGERDVLELLVNGRSNRQAADALGVSVRAVEVRRAKLMQKMKADSLAELVRLALAVLPESLPGDTTKPAGEQSLPGMAGRQRRDEPVFLE